MSQKPKTRLRRAKELWQEFTKIEDEIVTDTHGKKEKIPRAKCNECGTILKMRNSSTGGLRKHLQSLHSLIAAQVLAAETANKQQEDSEAIQLQDAVVEDEEYENKRDGKNSKKCLFLIRMKVTFCHLPIWPKVITLSGLYWTIIQFALIYFSRLHYQFLQYHFAEAQQTNMSCQ